MTAPNRQHGKTVEEWERMCLNKTRYSDEYTCRAGAQHVLTNPRFGMTVARMFVYKCPNCRGWHMTKQSTVHYSVSAENLFAD
jgi:predicted SprT family Zn-dependent metalloprotease